MNEIATKDEYRLSPTSFDDAKVIAEYLAKSDMVPKEYQGKPANIIVATSWGKELGLQYMQSLQNIAVINGKPAIYGDAAHAIVRSHPDCEDVIETVEGEGEQMVATCTVKRRGRRDVTRTFSVFDAKRARLWDDRPEIEVYDKYTKERKKIPNPGPWFCYPKRMLQMRARGFAERDAFPDALKGIGFVEEIAHMEKDITSEASHSYTNDKSIVMPKAKESAPEQETEQAQSEQQEPARTQEQQPTETQQKTKPEPEKKAEPSRQVEGQATLSAGQIRVVTAKAKAAGIELNHLAQQFNCECIEQIPSTSVNEVMGYIKEQTK